MNGTPIGTRVRPSTLEEVDVSTRESSEHHRARRPEEQQGSESTAADAAAHKEALDAEVDALLDDIDDVLEVNAEEFVRGFVQKGGQ
jgi:ubiquitin-like protein Pup